jgi:hypothetical protein
MWSIMCAQIGFVEHASSPNHSLSTLHVSLCWQELLAAEALMGLASSMQDQSRNECALGCYHVALQQLTTAGFGDCERSSVIHNNLGTLHERLAGAPDPGDPDWQAKPMPDQFSAAAEDHFSEAVRHLCVSLRWNQKKYGALSHQTADIHQNIASVCMWARLWHPYFKHHQAARIGMHVSLGPRHPESIQADRFCQMAMDNTPSSRAAVLAPGLEEELRLLSRC